MFRLLYSSRTYFTTRYQHLGGGCPEVNKFEQVFGDSHQMSLAEGVLRSHIQGGPEVGRGRRGGVLYILVQCIIGNGHMGPPHHVDRLTDTHEQFT